MSDKYCGFCGGRSHNRDICPHEQVEKLRPEWEKWQREAQKEADASRYGREYVGESS